MTIQILKLRSQVFFEELILADAATRRNGLVNTVRLHRELMASDQPLSPLFEQDNWCYAVRRLLKTKRLIRTSMRSIYRLNDPQYKGPAKTRQRRKKGRKPCPSEGYVRKHRKISP